MGGTSVEAVQTSNCLSKCIQTRQNVIFLVITSVQNNISLTVVFVKKADNTVEMKQVSTGIQDGTFIQITKGLNEGDEIVTGPYELLSKDLANSDKIKLEEKK